MNIIDRSPFKTSQEALRSQSTRLMNEAKTAAEKASVVQDFAEKLRLEKLRAKRLQENMKQLNTAISGGQPPGFQTQALSASRFGNASGPSQSTTSTIAGIGTIPGNLAPVQQQQRSGASASWMNPYLSGFGNAMKQPSAQPMAPQHVTNPTNLGLRHYPVDGISLEQLMKSSSTAASSSHAQGSTTTKPTMGPQSTATSTSSSQFPVTKAFSRPLNVYAPPFEMKPTPAEISVAKNPFYSAQSAFGPGHSLEARTNEIPVRVPVVASAASKAINMNSIQPNPTNLDGRQRSLSIGAQEKMVFDQKRMDTTASVGQQQLKETGGGYRTNSSIFGENRQMYPRSETLNSQAPANNFSTPQSENLAANGTSVSNVEDWDLEYAVEQKDPKRSHEPPGFDSEAGKRKVPFTDPMAKDWLSVLKERDNIAKRRYNRETMLRLTQADASKIRPDHLSSDYNTPFGLWSPDLWFHVNFQQNQPHQLSQENRPNGGRSRNAVSVDAADPPLVRDRSTLRPVNMIAKYVQMKEKEKEEQRSSSR